MTRLPVHAGSLWNACRMNQDLDGRGRTAIWFAHLSPVIGVPLIGPWIAYALLDDDSTARPYVARVFDLHLLTVVIGVAVLVLGLFFDPGVGVVAAGLVAMVSLVVNAALLFGALKRTRWSRPWQPVVLGGRSRYQPEPYIGPL